MEILIILLMMLLIVTWIFINPIVAKQRRQKIKNRPFPSVWKAIIENNLPIYPSLSPPERRRLQGHIQVFIAEKQFIGCQGLEVTEEIKVTTAAVACLLLLNERGKYFPKLHSILVYPSTYFVNETIATSNYIVQERRTARLGESWTNDQVVLSWQQVKQDTYNWRDGHNVVLHEFAHQLDQEDGKAEGVPILKSKPDYQLWAQVMTTEYQQLCDNIKQGKQTIINSYAGTSPAEFFAVATEAFFEKPQEISKKHHSLYTLLKEYYQ